MLHGLRRRASGHRHLLTGSVALVLTAGVQAVSGRAVLADRRAGRHADRRRPRHRPVHLGAVRGLRGRARPAGGRRPLRRRPHARRPRALRLGRAGHHGGLRSWSRSATSLVVSPPAVDELRDWHGALGPAVFVFLCVGTALSLLLDVRLMTQRRWGLVLAASLDRGRGPVPAPAPSRSTTTGPCGCSWWRPCPPRSPGTSAPRCSTRSPATATTSARCPATTRAMVRYSLVNWASTLTYQAPTFAMPVIVLVHVDADQQRQLLRGVGRGGARLLRAHRHRPGAALRGRPGRRPPAQPGAPRHRRGRRASWWSARRSPPLGRDLIVTLYGADYQEAADVLPRARDRRHPVGGHVRVPHRGPGAAPQRRHRADHGGAVGRDPRARARARARRRHRRRRHRVPRRQPRRRRRRARHPRPGPQHGRRAHPAVVARRLRARGRHRPHPARPDPRPP